MQDIVMQYLSEALTTIFLAGLGVLVRIVLIEWRKFQPKIEEIYNRKVDVATRELLAKIGHEAFVYAETMYKELAGPDRVQYAMEYATNVLNQYGVKVTSDEIYAAIHNAWLADKRQQQTH